MKRWAISIVGGVLVLVIAILFINIPYWPNWTGFNGKTLWDLMGLLIVPFALAIIAFLFNRAERRSEREIARNRTQETALQAYLDRMTELILDKNLLKSEKISAERSIARARTLTVLRGLDGRRKGILIQFLYESGLIKGDEAIIELKEADLGKVDLGWDNLNWAQLIEINLSGAFLGLANLSRANLISANLNMAKLGEANLSKATLIGAKVGWTDLTSANLIGANLQGTYLGWACLGKANLSGANLKGAYLDGADLSEANLDRITYDDDTEWPSGFMPPPGAIKSDVWQIIEL